MVSEGEPNGITSAVFGRESGFLQARPIATRAPPNRERGFGSLSGAPGRINKSRPGVGLLWSTLTAQSRSTRSNAVIEAATA